VEDYWNAGIRHGNRTVWIVKLVVEVELEEVLPTCGESSAAEDGCMKRDRHWLYHSSSNFFVWCASVDRL